jgi:hypothetical protein
VSLSRSGWSTRLTLIVLRATRRPMRGSRALYTTPIAPWPKSGENLVLAQRLHSSRLCVSYRNKSATKQSDSVSDEGGLSPV